MRIEDSLLLLDSEVGGATAVLSWGVICLLEPPLDLSLPANVQHASVCTFQTSPCMPATHAHVAKHVRVLPAYMGTFFLNVHTEAC